MAAPVAQPLHSSRNLASLEAVNAASVSELLDEHDEADDGLLAGLQRLFIDPPTPQEILDFARSHKLLLADVVVALFLVTEFLRRGQILFALGFGLVGLMLTVAGSKPRWSANPLYHASAWCYLVVLVAFPVLLYYEEDLGAMGRAKPAAVTKTAPGNLPTNFNPPPQPSSFATAPIATAPIATAPSASAPANEPTTEPEAPTPDPKVESVAETLAPRPQTPLLTAPIATVQREEAVAPATLVVPAPAATPLNPAVTDKAMLEATSSARLRSESEKAFAEDKPGLGLRYLYADALCRDQCEVWNYFRYSPLLRRPVLAVRWGMALELDDLGAQQAGIALSGVRGPINSIDQQTMLAKNLDERIMAYGGRDVVTWLRSAFDEGKFGDLELIRAPSTRQLRGATFLGFDTPAETLRLAKREELDLLVVYSVKGAGGSNRPNVAIRVLDVANGREILTTKYKSQPSMVASDVASLLASLSKKIDLSDKAEPADVESLSARVQALAARPNTNPLPLLCELVYYRRHNQLSAEQCMELANTLVGREAAASVIGGTDTHRCSALNQWINAK